MAKYIYSIIKDSYYWTLCTPQMPPTSSLCIILLICYWNIFANVLFQICSSILAIYLFIYFCCCSITVVPIFPPLLSHPTHPTSQIQPYPAYCLYPWVLYTCSLMSLPLLSSIIPLTHPLWLLLVRSLFPCVWLYFAQYFVLLIRFHL